MRRNNWALGLLKYMIFNKSEDERIFIIIILVFLVLAIVFGFPPVAAMIILLMLPPLSIHSGMEKILINTTKMQLSMPVSRNQIVAFKYILPIITTALWMIISFGVYHLTGVFQQINILGMFGVPMENVFYLLDTILPIYTMIAWSGLMHLIDMSLHYALGYTLFKNSKVPGLYRMICMGIPIGVFFVLGRFTESLVIVYTISYGIAFVIVGISYLISRQAFAKLDF